MLDFIFFFFFYLKKEYLPKLLMIYFIIQYNFCSGEKLIYRENPKNSDTQKFAVITLKVEQGSFTLE